MGTGLVSEREDALTAKLQGVSAAATAAEAEAAVERATEDVATGPGAAYGVGFGFLKDWDPRGDDGLHRGYVVTDGDRKADIVVKVDMTTLATLSHQGQDVDHWLQERLMKTPGS